MRCWKNCFDRSTRILRQICCIGLAGYVAWKANSIIPETYGDLAVPALMVLFCVSLLLVAASFYSQDQQRERG